MELKFDLSLINNYHSFSQKARVLTESWAANNIFCPRCGNEHILHFENNRPVADFYCPVCANEYELKSKSGNIEKRINDGAYHTMIERITSNNNPDLFCMSYDKNSYCVKELIFIPKHFFVPEIIEKRKPLNEKARRAGWIGCNILIDRIPNQGKIQIISNGIVDSIVSVTNKVRKSNLLEIKNISERGWIMDVLNCVNAIQGRFFTLNDMYQFENVLYTLHPANKNIQPKIRQQLQLLRDKGFIEFLGQGKYKKL